MLINILPALATGGLLSAGRFSSVLFPAFVWLAAADSPDSTQRLDRELRGAAGVQRRAVLHLAAAFLAVSRYPLSSALALLIALTIILTWPQALHLGSQGRRPRRPVCSASGALVVGRARAAGRLRAPVRRQYLPSAPADARLLRCHAARGADRGAVAVGARATRSSSTTCCSSPASCRRAGHVRARPPSDRRRRRGAGLGGRSSRSCPTGSCTSCTSSCSGRSGCRLTLWAVHRAFDERLAAIRRRSPACCSGCRCSRRVYYGAFLGSSSARSRVLAGGRAAAAARAPPFRSLGLAALVAGVLTAAYAHAVHRQRARPRPARSRRGRQLQRAARQLRLSAAGRTGSGDGPRSGSGRRATSVSRASPRSRSRSSG